jgi:hypothetical protein
MIPRRRLSCLGKLFLPFSFFVWTLPIFSEPIFLKENWTLEILSPSGLDKAYIAPNSFSLPLAPIHKQLAKENPKSDFFLYKLSREVYLEPSDLDSKDGSGLSLHFPLIGPYFEIYWNEEKLTQGGEVREGKNRLEVIVGFSRYPFGFYSFWIDTFSEKYPDFRFQNYGLTRFGFFFLVSGIAFTLANRFLKIHQEVEELNAELENMFSVRSVSKQKKEFEFRGKKMEIGGDINIVDQIRIAGKDYLVFINADAMGKSIQIIL